MAQMSDEEISRLGWEQANNILRVAVSNRTAEEASVQLDIVRHTAVSVLAIDLANARMQKGLTRTDSKAHLDEVMKLIYDLARALEERAKAGQTHVEKFKGEKVH